MESQIENDFNPRGMESYNLTRNSYSADQIKRTYVELQNKAWGVSSIIEGYYHVGYLEPVVSTIPTREQALAITHWKQHESDYFNTEVSFEVLLGALYNSRSVRPAVLMNQLIGEVIHVMKVDCKMVNDKLIYSVQWELTEPKFYIADDELLDAFECSEEDLIVVDQEESDNYGDSETEE